MSGPNVASPTLASPTVVGRVGYGETIAFLAACQATAAMAIDLILPAFGDIRTAVGLAPDATIVSLLITAFFVGSGVAQLPVGILTDRFGRKPVLMGGAALYAVAALAASVAPNLGVMLVCRFVWGMASAAPRVVSVAIARDQFSGSALAKTMSYVQGVFVIVPVLAPLLGQIILDAGGWRWAMAAPAGLALAILVWLRRIPESLPIEKRRSTSVVAVGGAVREVWRIKSTVRLALSVACMIGVVQAYLSVSDVITGQTYDRKSIFALIFGAIALAMGVAAFANGHLVGKVGQRAMLRRSPWVMLGVATIFAGGSLLSNAKPPFLFYCLCMAAVLAVQTFVFPNANSLALQPVGHIAGLASGLIGTQSTIIGAAIGVTTSALHQDGTLVLSCSILLMAAAVCWLVIGALRTTNDDQLH
jgi:MFS transporter, DHA1 family, multidrug resistance protein